MTTTIESTGKKTPNILQLADDIRSAERQLADLRRQIADAKLVLSVPEAEATLTDRRTKITEAEKEAEGIRASAIRDAEAIRGRGTLDAEAKIREATERASEIITNAEYRGTEILEQSRSQRERDHQTSNARIGNLETQARAVLDRLTTAHQAFLALETDHQADRRALLERAR